MINIRLFTYCNNDLTKQIEIYETMTSQNKEKLRNELKIF